jgi:DnaJ domain
VRDYYLLLEVSPDASHDDIKRAFRSLIARYHPDKVQHLGKEFQAMAADRAAELTEAYRVLADEDRRAEYDRQLSSAPPGPAPPPAQAASPKTPVAHVPTSAAEPSEAHAERGAAHLFSQERASRDEFVQRAVVGRLRQALGTVLGTFEEPAVRGFDVAAVPQTKLFARAKYPHLLARFVARVDKRAVVQTWGWATRWNVPPGTQVCVLLMGAALAPSGELAEAIIAQRSRAAEGDTHVTLVPVNSHDWHAHMPTDAPPAAKEILDRLRKGE